MHSIRPLAFVVLGSITVACTEANPFGAETEDPSSSGSPSSSTSPSTGTISTSTQSETTAADGSSSAADQSTGGEATSSTSATESGAQDTTTGESSSSTGATVICEQNGVIDEGETCDDDNPFDDDGCTQCHVDEGWVCLYEPSQCLPTCDPLLQDCELMGYACYPVDDDAVWACFPDASGEMGAFGDFCEFDYPNVCDPGLACADPDRFETCNPIAGCCAQLCDLDSPTCPIRWTCISYYEGAPPLGYEHVGVCAWQ